MKDKILFRRILSAKGNSLAVSIPMELLEYLEAKDGEMMVMCADSGKHGKFLSLWIDNK